MRRHRLGHPCLVPQAAAGGACRWGVTRAEVALQGPDSRAREWRGAGGGNWKREEATPGRRGEEPRRRGGASRAASLAAPGNRNVNIGPTCFPRVAERRCNLLPQNSRSSALGPPVVDPGASVGEAMAHDNPRFQAEPSELENKEEAANSEPSTLDCVICFAHYDRIFKVPKELSCSHIFCLECLARINVSSEDVNAITCPVCRAPTSLPSRKGLPGLPTRSDLLDQLSTLPAPPGSVRFDRRRGLLYLPGGRKGIPRAGAKPGAPINTVSLSVDVGRPAPRAGRMLSLSGWPFYVALAIALLVTIGLIICGIYIFLLPSMYTVQLMGPPQGNNSQGHADGNQTSSWMYSRPPAG